MKTFRMFGTLRYPVTVLINAEKPNRAEIRAHYGEFDKVENLIIENGIFEMDPERGPMLVEDGAPKRRYRVIFTEITQYAVEFLSSMTPEMLMVEDQWREALDRHSVSERYAWQVEDATDVISTELEHLEELPLKNATLADREKKEK